MTPTDILSEAREVVATVFEARGKTSARCAVDVREARWDESEEVEIAQTALRRGMALAADIAEAIDSGRGNESEIARALRCPEQAGKVTGGMSIDAYVEEMDERRDGWIPWTGGECPVHAKQKVVVKLRGDPPGIDYSREPPLPADTLDWERRSSIADIVAYRIIQS